MFCSKRRIPAANSYILYFVFLLFGRMWPGLGGAYRLMQHGPAHIDYCNHLLHVMSGGGNEKSLLYNISRGTFRASVLVNALFIVNWLWWDDMMLFFCILAGTVCLQLSVMCWLWFGACIILLLVGFIKMCHTHLQHLLLLWHLNRFYALEENDPLPPFGRMKRGRRN